MKQVMVVNFTYVIYRTFTPIPAIKEFFSLMRYFYNKIFFFYGIPEKLFKN